MESPQNQTFTCQVFYFVQAYVKVAFYFCMIPFRAIVDENGKLEFKEYRLHKVLCFTLHISSLCFGFTHIWNHINDTFKGHGLSSGASTTLYMFTLFALLNSAVVVLIVSCWFIKPNPYKLLLTQSFKLAENNVSCKPYRFANLWVVFMTLMQIAFTGNTEIWDLVSKSSFHLRTSTSSFLLYLLTVFQATYYQLLFQIAIVMPFDLTCLCMFIIGKSFRALSSIEYAILASPNTKWHHQSLERLTDYYLSVKSLVKVLNKTFNKAIIIIFLSVLPTLGYGLSCIFANTSVSLSQHIRTTYILFAYYVFLLLAAKGHSNVQHFTQSVFEQMWKSGALKTKYDGRDAGTRTLLLTLMQYVNSSCVGVGGTPFFICTYRLVGTVRKA